MANHIPADLRYQRYCQFASLAQRLDDELLSMGSMWRS